MVSVVNSVLSSRPDSALLHKSIERRASSFPGQVRPATFGDGNAGRGEAVQDGDTGSGTRQPDGRSPERPGVGPAVSDNASWFRVAAPSIARQGFVSRDRHRRVRLSRLCVFTGRYHGRIADVAGGELGSAYCQRLRVNSRSRRMCHSPAGQWIWTLCRTRRFVSLCLRAFHSTSTLMPVLSIDRCNGPCDAR